MKQEINIKLEAFEQGLELVKGFLDKLVGPSIEEVGLLLSDNIKLWRLKNQIKILNKAKKIVENNNLSIKNISLKVLVPLLEYSSLENDESLQDKWSNLLVNIADESSKITTNIYPFILSQLSSIEAKALLDFYKEKKIHYEDLYRKFYITDEQISNLVRLGLIKRSNPEIIKNSDIAPLDYAVENNFILTDSEYTEITELGLKFINIVEGLKYKK